MYKIHALIHCLGHYPVLQIRRDDGEIDVDVSDKAFEINTFNSNQFTPKHFASCEYQNTETATTPIKKIGEFGKCQLNNKRIQAYN